MLYAQTAELNSGSKHCQFRETEMKPTYVPIHIALWGTLLVVQLDEALSSMPEVRGFYSRWCHWNFSLT
jgi:hypothetical protein